MIPLSNHCHICADVQDLSILIGLTLAVNEDFKVLFVVIIFHRMSTYEPKMPFLTVGYRNVRRLGSWISTSVYAITTAVQLRPDLRSHFVRIDNPYRNSRWSRCSYHVQSRQRKGLNRQRRARLPQCWYPDIHRARRGRHLSISSMLINRNNLVATVACSRVLIQQGNDHQFEWQTGVRTGLYVIRMWDHGSARSLGLRNICYGVLYDSSVVKHIDRDEYRVVYDMKDPPIVALSILYNTTMPYRVTDWRDACSTCCFSIPSS